MTVFRKFTEFDATLRVSDVLNDIGKMRKSSAVLLRGTGNQLFPFRVDELRALLAKLDLTEDPSIDELLRKFKLSGSPVIPTSSKVLLSRSVIVDKNRNPKWLTIAITSSARVEAAQPKSEAVFTETAELEAPSPKLDYEVGCIGAPRPARPTRGWTKAEPLPPPMRAIALASGEPAAATAAVATEQPVVADEGTKITRWPNITSKTSARPSQQLELTVDLRLNRPQGMSDATAIRPVLEENWKEEPITVSVYSPLLQFPQGNSNKVVVRRNADSVPCTFAALVDAAASGVAEIDVLASFWYRGRFSGNCNVTIPVEGEHANALVASTHDDASDAATAPAPENGTAAKLSQGALAIVPSAKAPDLTVKIDYRLVGSSHLFHWEVEPQEHWEGYPTRTTDWVQLQSSPAAVIQGMLSAIAQQSGGFEQTVLGLGTKIFDHSADCFRDLYWVMRERLGKNFSIQFVTDDPNIPWELMAPYDKARKINPEILSVKHPVGRWILNCENAMSSVLPTGKIYSIAPLYDKRPIKPLKVAVEVSSELHKKYEAKEYRPATTMKVANLFQGKIQEPVALLHIGAHGKFVGQSPDASLVCLEDGDITAAQVGIPDFTGSTLAGKCKTFVILNACEVCESAQALDSMGGWANALLSAGFSGFIAPLWSVSDNDAGVFIMELIERLWEKKMPVGEALQQIRMCYGKKSPTFYSYLYYGDVMAHFV